MINGPPDFRVSQLVIKAYVCDYLGIDGHGSRPLHSLCISCLVLNMLHDYVLCVVNNIHGNVYMEKRNTRVRTHNLGGSEKG